MFGSSPERGLPSTERSVTQSALERGPFASLGHAPRAVPSHISSDDVAASQRGYQSRIAHAASVSSERPPLRTALGATAYRQTHGLKVIVVEPLDPPHATEFSDTNARAAERKRPAIFQTTTEPVIFVYLK